MKNTDLEILSAEAEVISGIITVTAVCQRIGITPPTYYRRLKQIQEKKENVIKLHENVSITIERLDDAANEILNTLQQMLKNGDGYDIEKHDELDVIKTTVTLISNYRAALQKATTLIDNRQVHIGGEQLCARCSRPLNDRIAEYRGLFDVNQYEAKILKDKIIDI